MYKIIRINLDKVSWYGKTDLRANVRFAID